MLLSLALPRDNQKDQSRTYPHHQHLLLLPPSFLAGCHHQDTIPQQPLCYFKSSRDSHKKGKKAFWFAQPGDTPAPWARGCRCTTNQLPPLRALNQNLSQPGPFLGHPQVKPIAMSCSGRFPSPVSSWPASLASWGPCHSHGLDARMHGMWHTYSWTYSSSVPPLRAIFSAWCPPARPLSVSGSPGAPGRAHALQCSHTSRHEE